MDTKNIIESLVEKYPHTWIEVNMNAIRSNIIALKDTAAGKNKDFLMTVKANAYGHGLEKVAVLAETLGAKFLGISYIDEAVKLRQESVKAPILLFTEPDKKCIDCFNHYSITPVVSSLEFLSEIAKWCLKKKEELIIHIKINTGLNRFGFKYEELETVIELLIKNPLIKVEGILTHYSSADTDLLETKKELDIFFNAVERFNRSSFEIRFIHASNSAATGWLNESQTNLVRLGLAAYGLLPSITKSFPISLAKALSWKTRIVNVLDVRKGEKVGYGSEWVADKDSRIGVIGVGYSDGFRRSPFNYKHVLCHGIKVPIIGKVMMSHAMVDLTRIKNKVCLKDEVVIIGNQQGSEITLEEIATNLGTINEEVVTSISPSIIKIYK